MVLIIHGFHSTGLYPVSQSCSSGVFFSCSLRFVSFSSVNNLKELIPASVMRNSNKGPTQWAGKIVKEYSNSIQGKELPTQVCWLSLFCWLLGHSKMFNPYSANVTMLCPPNFPPVSHLCTQIRGLFCEKWERKIYNSLWNWWKPFNFILQKLQKELVQK